MRVGKYRITQCYLDGEKVFDSNEVKPVAENSKDQWYVEIRKPNTQCPYFEGEDDSCFVLSNSEGEPTACEMAPCPFICSDGK